MQSRTLNLLYIRASGSYMVFVLSNNYDSRDEFMLFSPV